MILKSLSLINYKNFTSKTFEFDAKINCFVGNNGVGKTNILDAIYHLSFGKSYFNPVTSQNINHNADFFVIDGIYNKSEREEKVVISAKKGQKKVYSSQSSQNTHTHITCRPRSPQAKEPTSHGFSHSRSHKIKKNQQHQKNAYSNTHHQHFLVSYCVGGFFIIPAFQHMSQDRGHG